MAREKEAITVALAGNPNVGKSTVFNHLTGLHQHTGNWPGKTVDSARGTYTYKGQTYHIVDIPGTYSLSPHSPEEEIARAFICSGKADVTVVVCDATALPRNLNLVLQTLEMTGRAVLCLNLMDEAKRRGISINVRKLSERLHIPVVPMCARSGKGFSALLEQIRLMAKQKEALPLSIPRQGGEHPEQDLTADIFDFADAICAEVISYGDGRTGIRQEKLDRLLTGRLTGIPLMILLLLFILWLTTTGANYPSALLSSLFSKIETYLSLGFFALGAPVWLHDALVLGVFRVLSWVVAVMLPPMAIFFPLFTLLEDLGYLPRIAFTLDAGFKKCAACGKQALTMCMGFGCNAVGVTGCRIIDSPRERLLAILTNCFVPCNGRFPTLIAMISMFFIAGGGFLSSLGSAALLTALIVLAVCMTLLVCRLLSATLLKGVPSSFVLELPPYRRPQIGKVIIRSVLDRTLFVLGRAAIVAAPAGLLIFLLANISVGGISIISHAARFFDPFARLFGLDGVIFLAFLLGFPANEIVLPIAVMMYLATGSLSAMPDLLSLKTLLLQNGWTPITALCTILFSLFHFPCGTTLLTIKKETGSLPLTILGFFLPTFIGLFLCLIVNGIGRLFMP